MRTRHGSFDQTLTKTVFLDTSSGRNLCGINLGLDNWGWSWGRWSRSSLSSCLGTRHSADTRSRLAINGQQLHHSPESRTLKALGPGQHGRSRASDLALDGITTFDVLVIVFPDGNFTSGPGVFVDVDILSGIALVHNELELLVSEERADRDLVWWNRGFDLVGLEFLADLLHDWSLGSKHTSVHLFGELSFSGSISDLLHQVHNVIQMLLPLNGFSDWVLKIRRLSIEGLVVVDVIGKEAGIHGRGPSTTKTDAQQPVRISDSISTKSDKRTVDFPFSVSLHVPIQRWNKAGCILLTVVKL
mmetsp:Transcript_5637/g.13289  ORF Transcript_5637/g.13289 Transcript_5637/m.13289 type:complete len:302 (-) Transcript_5637:1600-2505(-)